MIIALVGMPGSGKSEAVKVFQAHGFSKVRFGQATDDEIKKRSLPAGEQSEKAVRENFRQQLGMAAFAILNLPKIKAIKGDIIIDGLRSFEENEFLKSELGLAFKLVEIQAPRNLRYQRIAKRKDRPFTEEEMKVRDRNELDNLNMGKTLESADFHILNDATKKELEKMLERIIETLKGS